MRLQPAPGPCGLVSGRSAPLQRTLSFPTPQQPNQPPLALLPPSIHTPTHAGARRRAPRGLPLHHLHEEGRERDARAPQGCASPHAPRPAPGALPVLGSPQHTPQPAAGAREYILTRPARRSCPRDDRRRRSQPDAGSPSPLPTPRLPALPPRPSPPPPPQHLYPTRSPPPRTQISTFHSLCARLLREFGPERIPGCKLNRNFTNLDDDEKSANVACAIDPRTPHGPPADSPWTAPPLSQGRPCRFLFCSSSAERGSLFRQGRAGRRSGEAREDRDQGGLQRHRRGQERAGAGRPHRLERGATAPRRRPPLTSHTPPRSSGWAGPPRPL